jgi:hypothetical protein
MDVFVYWILAWYLDNILPDAFGARQPLYFFLLPSYWGLKKEGNKTEQDRWLDQYKVSLDIDDKEDDDVAAERKKALSNTMWPAVKVVNLRKIYNPPLLKWRKKDSTKVAVKNSCITFEEGEL